MNLGVVGSRHYTNNEKFAEIVRDFLIVLPEMQQQASAWLRNNLRGILGSGEIR